MADRPIDFQACTLLNNRERGGDAEGDGGMGGRGGWGFGGGGMQPRKCLGIELPFSSGVVITPTRLLEWMVTVMYCVQYTLYCTAVSRSRSGPERTDPGPVPAPARVE